MKKNVEQRSKASFAEGFHFIPLGGSEEFGVNFNLYACDGKWMIFDCGIGFADQRFPGVDILLPDPSFIEDYKSDILGMVITHGHEDHVGAVPYIWPRLKCPIYCTKFTAAVLRAKMNERPECKGAKIIEISTERELELAPFKFKFIHVAHSIPQAVATVVKTSYGNVLHSGDWNLDPTPVIDKPTDEAALRKAGDRSRCCCWSGTRFCRSTGAYSGDDIRIERRAYSKYLRSGRENRTQCLYAWAIIAPHDIERA